MMGDEGQDRGDVTARPKTLVKTMFAFFDPMYLLILSPGLLLAMYAAARTRSTFAKYSQVGSRRGYTGEEAAAEMLRRSGVGGVRIEPVRGMLTDHYDPRVRVLRLSESVFYGQSLAAIGVACHEAGHAIQHARGYAALALRSVLVPATSICSTLYVWVIVLGGLIHPRLAVAGVAMLGVAVVFALVTLPVEWDASRRAKRAMANVGLLSAQELPHAAKVLDAAFLTYVAGAVTSLLTLLYWLLRLGLLGGRRD